MHCFKTDSSSPTGHLLRDTAVVGHYQVATCRCAWNDSHWHSTRHSAPSTPTSWRLGRARTCRCRSCRRVFCCHSVLTAALCWDHIFIVSAFSRCAGVRPLGPSCGGPLRDGCCSEHACTCLGALTALHHMLSSFDAFFSAGWADMLPQPPGLSHAV